jgi:hypothetical protein
MPLPPDSLVYHYTARRRVNGSRNLSTRHLSGAITIIPAVLTFDCCVAQIDAIAAAKNPLSGIRQSR